MNKLQSLLHYHFTIDASGDSKRVELLRSMIESAKGVANITTCVNREPERNRNEREVADSVYWCVVQSRLAAELRWYVKESVANVPPIKGDKLDCGLGCREMLSLALDDISYFSLADGILACYVADYVRFASRKFGFE